MSMIFVGVEPIPQNDPLVELRVGGRLLDLHNCASFLGFTYELPGSLSVRFRFDVRECLDPPIGTAPGSDLELRFDGVSDFVATRGEDRIEAETLEHILYRGPDFPLEMVFGDGLSLSCSARSMAVTLTPPEGLSFMEPP